MKAVCHMFAILNSAGTGDLSVQFNRNSAEIPVQIRLLMQHSFLSEYRSAKGQCAV